MGPRNKADLLSLRVTKLYKNFVITAQAPQVVVEHEITVHLSWGLTDGIIDIVIRQCRGVDPCNEREID